MSPLSPRALLSNQGPGSAALARAREYLLRRRKADGTWDSFWWASPLYATTTTLSLLYATEPHLDLPGTQQTLVSMAVENAFERALLIEALTQIRADEGATASQHSSREGSARCVWGRGSRGSLCPTAVALSGG